MFAPDVRRRPAFNPADPFKGVNPRDPTFRADPFPALARLRAHAPVDEVFGVWRLARYRDCVRLLREIPTSVRLPERGARRVGREGEAFGTEQFMLHQDPPAHTRLRRLVATAFTPRAIER